MRSRRKTGRALPYQSTQDITHWSSVSPSSLPLRAPRSAKLCSALTRRYCTSAEVVTDAKPEAVSFYQGLGFVAVEGVREGLLHGEPLPIFLAIETIASAL